MSKKEPDVEVPEEANAVNRFVETLYSLFYAGIVLINGPDMPIKGDKTVSAKKVHNMIIGVWSNDDKFIFLFPELLLKNLKEVNIKRLWHPVFASKKNLREMLIRERLILGNDDNLFVKYVRYNGVRVKVWQLDWTEFSNRCCNDAIKAN